MKIFSRSTLRDFWDRKSDSEKQLKAWFAEAKRARWKTPHDVKNQYPQASIIGERDVVFNICHNKYRLAVNIEYLRGWVFIKFLGTHPEYDKWNKRLKR